MCHNIWKQKLDNIRAILADTDIEEPEKRGATPPTEWDRYTCHLSDSLLLIGDILGGENNEQ